MYSWNIVCLENSVRHAWLSYIAMIQPIEKHSPKREGIVKITHGYQHVNISDA